MQYRIVANAALALMVAACGGGGGGVTEPAPAPVRAQASQAQVQAQQAADPTTGALRVYQAFHGRAPTAAEFLALSSPDAMTLATGFASSFSTLGDAAMARAVLGNMRVGTTTVNAESYAILETALTQYFAAFGANSRGVIVNNLVGLLAGLDSDLTWGSAARAFNASVTAARAVVTASTSSGATCVPVVAQGFQGSFDTTAASAGDSGGSGSGVGGSGGGAAAGGGLGKVLGGIMTVTDLSSGTVVGQGTTDPATGLVTIRTCSLAGPFLLTLEGRSGAKYFDEGLNALVDFPMGQVLHALVDAWDEHVGVSPVTEAAYRYALNNYKANASSVASGATPLAVSAALTGLTAAQVRQANALVAAEVNAKLPDAYQLSSAKSLPTPIDASSGTAALPNTRYGRSAAINGGLVQAAHHYNQNVSAPALAIANGLARDLTDGRIDGFALDGTQVATSASLTYASTDLALSSTVGTNAVARRFGSGTLLPAQLTVDREAFIGTNNGQAIQCDDFRDEAALLSDGSVTVLRYLPVQSGGTCAYLPGSPPVKTRNFLTGVKSITRGGGMVMAVKTDGTVHGWGRNFCGSLSPALPNGVYAQPQLLPGLSNVTAASSNGFASILRDGSGNVFHFGVSGGFDSQAVLPENRVTCGIGGVTVDGRTWMFTQFASMQQVALPNIIDVLVASGGFFALRADGVLYGWGEGVNGVLANSTGVFDTNGSLAGDRILAPMPIAGLGPVRQVIEVGLTVFALQRDGTVLAWGDDRGMLLGRGSRQPTQRPTAVAGVGNVVHMAGTTLDSIRLQRGDGSVLMWGREISAAFPFLPNPTPVTPVGRVRSITGSGSSFTVFLGSGTVVRDVTSTADISERYR